MSEQEDEVMIRNIENRIKAHKGEVLDKQSKMQLWRLNQDLIEDLEWTIEVLKDYMGLGYDH